MYGEVDSTYREVDFELGQLIAKEVKAFGDQAGRRSTLYHQDADIWWVEKGEEGQSGDLLRQVQISVFRERGGDEYVFFMPQLLRWEGGNLREGGRWKTARPDAWMRYPLKQLYPRRGTEEETREKIKIILEYAWLAAELLIEEDLK